MSALLFEHFLAFWKHIMLMPILHFPFPNPEINHLSREFIGLWFKLYKSGIWLPSRIMGIELFLSCNSHYLLFSFPASEVVFLFLMGLCSLKKFLYSYFRNILANFRAECLYLIYYLQPEIPNLMFLSSAQANFLWTTFHYVSCCSPDVVFAFMYHFFALVLSEY